MGTDGLRETARTGCFFRFHASAGREDAADPAGVI